MSASATKPRSVAFALLAILLGTVAGLAIIETGLRYYAAYVRSREDMDAGFLVFDPQLGWRMASNWSGRHRHYDFDVRYTTNAPGLRGTWPTSSTGGSEERQRFAFVGDSFTFGLGVNDDETFVQRLADADPSTIYLNAGIAGFSTDQEYLFLKDRFPAWHLDRMGLVVYLANDLLDNTLRYPLQAEMGKPFFKLESRELKLWDVPVPLQQKPPEERRRTLGSMVLGDEASRREHSWRNRWQLPRTLGLGEKTDASALAQMPGRLAYPVDLFLQLTREIHRLAEENGITMTVILMPGRSYVELPESLSAQFQEFLRSEILRRQGELGVPVIDLASRLREELGKRKPRLFYPNEGHLTAAGHQTVADLIRSGARRPDPPGGWQQFRI